MSKRSANFSPKRFFCSSSAFKFWFVWCDDDELPPIHPSSSFSQWILVSTPGCALRWLLLLPAFCDANTRRILLLVLAVAALGSFVSCCRLPCWVLRNREYGDCGDTVEAMNMNEREKRIGAGFHFQDEKKFCFFQGLMFLCGPEIPRTFPQKSFVFKF